MHPFSQAASLTTTHLRLTLRATTPLELDASSGSALRGSLFNAVWERFCTNKSANTCAACPLNQLCPVSALVAPLREESERGQDIPRPYVLVPPLEGARRYAPGECFSFGITLVGTILQLLPYLLLSLSTLEANGLGHVLEENGWKRGRFRVERVETSHPFTRASQTIYEAGQTRVQAPTITLHPEDWEQRAAQLDNAQITLRFLTPLRLVNREHLVKQASFRPLVQRLLERYLALERYYGNAQVSMERDQREEYLSQAESIVCISDETTWLEFQSHSSRKNRSTPTSGLLGQATFRGPLAPFLQLLVIGELIHAGKNAVKGNGKYVIVQNGDN